MSKILKQSASFSTTDDQNFKRGAPSPPISTSSYDVGSVTIGLDENLSAGSTNVPIAIAFDASDLQGFALVADVDMTVKTNSTSSPGNTINLKAGRVMPWSNSDGYYASPFTVDVTSFYVTPTDAGRIQGIFLT